jgi:hypothetical protein
MSASRVGACSVVSPAVSAVVRTGRVPSTSTICVADFTVCWMHLMAYSTCVCVGVRARVRVRMRVRMRVCVCVSGGGGRAHWEGAEQLCVPVLHNGGTRIREYRAEESLGGTPPASFERARRASFLREKCENR